MHDSIQKFIIEDVNCRCVIIRLHATLAEILSQYQYPTSIQTFLSECLAASALCSATLKYEGQLTLQMQAEGPIKMIVAKCNDKFQLRGLARYADVTDEELLSACLQGKLVVTIQADNNAKSYQSIINLNHDLARSFGDYFQDSEQINTKLAFAQQDGRCIGVLLQSLPATDKPVVTLLPNQLHADKLLAQDNVDYLQQLFPQHDIRMFDAEKVSFACTCSRERSLSSAQMMDAAEIAEIFNANPYLVVTCEYCNTEYTFSRSDFG